MKRIEFSKEKSIQLKKERNISFEEISQIITKNAFLAIIKHPNIQRYPHQKMFLVKMKEYIYVVPFVEDEEKIFLKTAFANRKYTKMYMKK